MTVAWHILKTNENAKNIGAFVILCKRSFLAHSLFILFRYHFPRADLFIVFFMYFCIEIKMVECVHTYISTDCDQMSAFQMSNMSPPKQPQIQNLQIFLSKVLA